MFRKLFSRFGGPKKRWVQEWAADGAFRHNAIANMNAAQSLTVPADPDNVYIERAVQDLRSDASFMSIPNRRLELLGEKAAPALAAALDDLEFLALPSCAFSLGGDFPARAALRLLTRAGSPLVIEPALRIARSGNNDLRGKALQAIAAIEPSRGIEMLRETLRGENFTLRGDIVLGLKDAAVAGRLDEQTYTDLRADLIERLTRSDTSWTEDVVKIIALTDPDPRSVLLAPPLWSHEYTMIGYLANGAREAGLLTDPAPVWNILKALFKSVDFTNHTSRYQLAGCATCFAKLARHEDDARRLSDLINALLDTEDEICASAAADVYVISLGGDGIIDLLDDAEHNVDWQHELLLLRDLNVQVKNGGFGQWFANERADDHTLLIELCDVYNAPGVKAAITSACSVIGAKPTDSAEDLRKRYAKMPPKKEDQLHACGNMYFANEAETHRAMLAIMRKHAPEVRAHAQWINEQRANRRA